MPPEPNRKSLTNTSEEFFDKSWDIYRRVVESNAMHHDEVRQSWKGALEKQFPSPAVVSILDIGCGDCSQSTALLKHLPTISVSNYTAVDLSAHVLQLAGQTLKEALPGAAVRLHNTDMLSYVLQAAEESGLKYDIIWTAFCSHHLVTKEKIQFLSATKELLKPGGVLLWADVFNSESAQVPRQELFDLWEARIAPELHTLKPQEIKSHIFGHIREYDYPEVIETYVDLSTQAGYTSETLYTDSYWIWSALLKAV